MHPSNRWTVNRLIDIMADSLRTMTDQELELLLHGKGKLGFISATRMDKDPEPDRDLMDAAKEIADQLAQVDSREAAKELLASIEQPRMRDFLVRVAQTVGVRIGAKDSVARIEQKLIQATIGSKLRSRAFKEVSF